MSEAICVCGHREEFHDEDNWFRFCEPPHKVRCKCDEYREAIDWPDSEGWWWCDRGDGFGLLYAFEATISAASEFISCSVHDDMARDQHLAKYGSARFVKLIEPNPFQPDPARAREV